MCVCVRECDCVCVCVTARWRGGSVQPPRSQAPAAKQVASCASSSEPKSNAQLRAGRLLRAGRCFLLPRSPEYRPPSPPQAGSRGNGATNSFFIRVYEYMYINLDKRVTGLLGSGCSIRSAFRTSLRVCTSRKLQHGKPLRAEETAAIGSSTYASGLRPGQTPSFN